jgi:hypothetical protein
MSPARPEAVDLDPLPFILAYRAAIAAGISDAEIAAVIHRAVRRATGLPPIRARQWFGHQLLAAERQEFTVIL